jgi:RimJ/RimL family protein N-acetyltransferase
VTTRGLSSERPRSAGYFAQDIWGHGFAIEAALACAEWGFQNFDLPYLTAMIRPDNRRSIRVAERLDMSPLREDLLLEEPVVVYSINREEWTQNGPTTHDRQP